MRSERRPAPPGPGSSRLATNGPNKLPEACLLLTDLLHRPQLPVCMLQTKPKDDVLAVEITDLQMQYVPVSSPEECFLLMNFSCVKE